MINGDLSRHDRGINGIFHGVGSVDFMSHCENVHGIGNESRHRLLCLEVVSLRQLVGNPLVQLVSEGLQLVVVLNINVCLIEDIQEVCCVFQMDGVIFLFPVKL